jgi:hypothetical protein
MAGRKRKHRAERKWTHRRVLRSTFLSNVRRRLVNDVGPYFTTIQAVHDQTGKGIGFWALARMIFPVVEAISTVIYRTGTKERPSVRLLRELGFEYPNLVWEMYRHTLMHNDEMASASYRGRRITWGIGIGTGHFWNNGRLHIDAAKLYNDLIEFLDHEALRRRSKTSHVWIKESFRFNTGFSRATRDEALRLGSS